MNVRYSPRAIRDLASIADYLGQRSATGARAVELRIRATVELIANFPGAGRSLAQRPAVRVMPVRRYPCLIFYTSGAEILILHIRHSSRKPIDPAKL